MRAPSRGTRYDTSTPFFASSARFFAWSTSPE
jgi:hypothetical protein